MQSVVLPDGQEMRFPAGTPREVMLEQIGKYYQERSAPPGTQVANVTTELGKGIPVAGAFSPHAHAAIGAVLQHVPGLTTSEKTFGQDFDEGLKARETATKKFEETRPGLSAGLQVLGGAAALSPVAATRAGANALGMAGPLLMRPVKAALTGATLAGSDAAVKGEPVVPNAVAGGMIGAAAPLVGGIAHNLGERAATGWTALQDVLRGVNPASGPLKSMDPLALRWAYRAAKADGLDDAAISQKLDALGPKGFLGEYGPNLRAVTGYLAAKPGAGKTQIFDAFDRRVTAWPEDIRRELDTAIGPEVNMALYARRIAEDQSDTTNPLYKAWRGTVVTPTPELKALIPRLEAADAFGQAEKKAALAGVPFDRTFFTSGATKSYPTAQSWDYVKRSLDSQIDTAVRAGDRDQVRILGGLKNELVSAIDNHPDPKVAGVWKAARQAWAEPEAIKEALTLGTGWRDIAPDELHFVLRDMSAPQRTAFIQGMRSDIAEIMDDTRRGGTKVKDLLLVPSNERRLEALVGPDRAAALVKSAQQNATHAGNTSRVLANSETAPREFINQEMTPNPEALPLVRYRHVYSPHVTPGMLIPRSLARAAEEEQAAKFEAGRDALAPYLVKQGNEAADFLRALMAYKPPGEQIAPSASYIGNLLTHGAAPQLRPTAKRLSDPLLPQGVR